MRLGLEQGRACVPEVAGRGLQIWPVARIGVAQAVAASLSTASSRVVAPAMPRWATTISRAAALARSAATTALPRATAARAPARPLRASAALPLTAAQADGA